MWMTGGYGKTATAGWILLTPIKPHTHAQYIHIFIANGQAYSKTQLALSKKLNHDTKHPYNYFIYNQC
jgi:hypothetical protein